MIIATSGIVLGSKDFPRSDRSGRMEIGRIPSGQSGLVVGGDGGGSTATNGGTRMLIGNVLTTLIQFSDLTAGMRMCYMELQGSGVSIVGGHGNRPYCVVFHDLEDGAELGKLLANQILGAFWELYGR